MTGAVKSGADRLISASQPMTPSRPMNASRPMTPSRPMNASWPMTPSRPMTASRPISAYRQMSTYRPMTAVSGASYTSSISCDSTNDPSDKNPSLEAEDEDMSEMHKILEEEVNELIKESWIAQSKGDLKLALEKAIEAVRNERALVKQREKSGYRINVDLSFTVLFNLANQFENNKMYPEALSTYRVMVKNRNCNYTGLLRLSMANIYVRQKNYPKAIKLYCKALDRTPNCHKKRRMKIKQNIGVVFVHMHQYPDAICCFEEVMRESPNVTVGYNLVLCYYAIGDKMMRNGFEMLLLAPLGTDDEAKHFPSEGDTCPNATIESMNDELHQTKEAQEKQAEKYIVTAAKLIAPAMETSAAAGLDWCMNMVKNSQHSELASDLEFAKAIAQLKQKDFKPAFEILNKFHLKDSRVKGNTANNLSFRHFLDKNYDQAEEYAHLALKADPHNPAALINKGNAVFGKQDYERAVECYKEALTNHSACTEALYNLGLCYKKLTCPEEALHCFLDLHSILRNDNQVIYQLVKLFELLGDNHQAIEWLMHIISSTPTDPSALAKLGQLHDATGDKLQAYQYYYESFKLYPCSVEVIEWLAGYYIQTQSCGKAIKSFERAAVLQPTLVKWRLLVAACYRRNGDYQKALEKYKHIHCLFPEDIECLRFLVNLCMDMGLKEVNNYKGKLEKAMRISEQRLNSGRRLSVHGWRESTEGSVASADFSNSIKQHNRRSMIRLITTSDEPYEANAPNELDAFYVDPLGPQMARPKTGGHMLKEVVGFNDVVLGENFLP
ncbi:intraflagellar transport protein 88 homolog isoform X2 [Hippoglossus hippoglossus]|uniref:intraflagellar transport protein 88 homolog isoform X2 n=1 Tax=Hippoglossus hippoglossus TaxID=8267 RepID=UPI00148D4B1E|nr:intraflagellar transport protein 88 homolog isoform X2 [Hippoglossus hippoglossus]